jgi:hypothetical protein
VRLFRWIASSDLVSAGEESRASKGKNKGTFRARDPLVATAPSGRRGRNIVGSFADPALGGSALSAAAHAGRRSNSRLFTASPTARAEPPVSTAPSGHRGRIESADSPSQRSADCRSWRLHMLGRRSNSRLVHRLTQRAERLAATASPERRGRNPSSRLASRSAHARARQRVSEATSQSARSGAAAVRVEPLG